MRTHRIRVGPDLRPGVLVRGDLGHGDTQRACYAMTQKCTEGRKGCEDRGRDRVILLQAREGLGPPEAGRGKKGFLPPEGGRSC